MNTTRLGSLMVIGATLVGCSQPQQTAADLAPPSPEVSALRSEIEQLKRENTELKQSPGALSADFAAAVAAKDQGRMADLLQKLQTKYPNSPEARAAKQQADALAAEEEAKKEEAARLAALGFKALTVRGTAVGTDANVTLRSAAITGQWTFDAYGDEWHYQESERGKKFVTAKVTVSSDNKDPSLPGIAVYKADGDTLRRVGLFEYRFSRWGDYGSYLGNYADYRNDFAHSNSIPFSIGSEVAQEELKSTLYIVATKEGCFGRNEERFNNPPVNYYSLGCNSLPDALKVSDFVGGKLTLLKRLN